MFGRGAQRDESESDDDSHGYSHGRARPASLSGRSGRSGRSGNVSGASPSLGRVSQG